MSLKGAIADDMKTAMKAGDKDRLKVVRLILAAIKQVEVDTRNELDDAAVLGVIEKMVKQRRDSVEQFTKGGRTDLADIETAEIAVLETYLPEQLDDAQIEAIVNETISQTGAESIRDMGKVMGAIKARVAGQADMGVVGAKVKARLAG
ncbi:MAG: GatB/YqeY domain-containing protein [Woeseiaceae bacterium]|nr:GatB/YqeY domain-containing protein [Woeseiaceae bacterium]